MPIRPENRARYPANWKEIRAQILERAGNRCEGSPKYPDCRAPNGWLRRDRDGRMFQSEASAAKRCRESDWLTKIVLTIAHLDHTPENCDPANLRAWCQRCHLTYDAEHHAQTAYQTRRAGRAAGDLFEIERVKSAGPYSANFVEPTEPWDEPV